MFCTIFPSGFFRIRAGACPRRCWGALPGRGATAPSILLLVLLLTGLNPAPVQAAPIEVVDDTGVTLTLDKPAERIIALYGAYNELLLALDARDLLVARTVADGGESYYVQGVHRDTVRALSWQLVHSRP